jgi:flagellar basal-body rod protein FlgC
MTLFGAIGVASTGISVHRAWLDAVSDNIANINDASPTSGNAFQARYIKAQAVNNGSGGGGVRIAGVALSGNTTGRIVNEPDNPLADANGNVRYPDIDLGSQMTQMMIAQRGYQANLAVVDRAKEAYQAAIQLGRGA